MLSMLGKCSPSGHHGPEGQRQYAARLREMTFSDDAVHAGHAEHAVPVAV